ncbi:MAG: transposase [Mailhella sp.]|nr:transposase [Mailhella sp.]
MQPYKLTNAQWRKLEPYVASQPKRGRPPADARGTLEAVIHVLSSGCRWDELPPEMGSHITAWRRWRKWKEDGTMDIIQSVIPVLLTAPSKSRV